MDNDTYIVRRLTPKECCRLQGFPDGYDEIPDVSELSDDDYAFWQNVHSEDQRITDKKQKPFKSKEECIKWLNKLGADAARYKMWGNGMAFPNLDFVIKNIAGQYIGGRYDSDLQRRLL